MPSVAGEVEACAQIARAAAPRLLFWPRVRSLAAFLGADPARLAEILRYEPVQPAHVRDERAKYASREPAIHRRGGLALVTFVLPRHFGS